MTAPRPGYGKNYAVRWLGRDGETMYSGAMTRVEALRLVIAGHWHLRAYPTLTKLKLK